MTALLAICLNNSFESGHKTLGEIGQFEWSMIVVRLINWKWMLLYFGRMYFLRRFACCTSQPEKDEKSEDVEDDTVVESYVTRICPSVVQLRSS